VAFLDSDVSLDREWLRRSVAFLESDPRIGIVGGKLLYADAPHRLNSFGGVTGAIGLGWDAHEGDLSEAVQKPRPSLWVSCSAMLVRRELLSRVGGFDETFFYGYEESDLGWRANLAGFAVVAIPEALAYHRVGAAVGRSDPQIVFHYCKNRLRSLLKNYGPARLACWLPAYLAYSVVDGLVRAPRAAKLRALAWNVASLGDTLARRRDVQRLRRRPDRELAPLFSKHLFPPVPLANRRRRPAPDDGMAPNRPGAEAPADDRVAVVPESHR
jgi:GT2 family glycosyltransferase